MLRNLKVNRTGQVFRHAPAEVFLNPLLQRRAWALTQKDRQIVAGIFLKRLSEGQFLQSDATVAYGLGQTIKKVLDAVDIASDTPYNTYLYKGLPKAPITNPSLISIEAVFQPTLMDYNYFLSDKSGNLHFAVTYEEHLQNRAQYIGN